MVSVCLSSDALFKHLPSYLGFSYLGHGVSLHGCSSKAQLLLLTLVEGYLLIATLPDLQHGMAPLSPPVPLQPLLLACGVALSSCRLWPWTRCGSSWLPPLASDTGWLLLAAAPDLDAGYLFTAAPAKHSCCSLPWMRSPLLTLIME